MYQAAHIFFLSGPLPLAHPGHPLVHTMHFPRPVLLLLLLLLHMRSP